MVDEVNHELILEGIEVLNNAFDKPYGLVFVREYQMSIDLLAARELIHTLSPNQVAIANVTTSERTREMIEFEKVIFDLIPVGNFFTLEEAIPWVSEIVLGERERRKNQS